MPRKFRYKVGDFETVVYDGQESTEVWASALVNFWSDEVDIFHSIDETFGALIKEKGNIVVYYHNLKFDGAFWLVYLLSHGWEQAGRYSGNDVSTYEWLPLKEMVSGQFRYSISDMGQWYSITLKHKGRLIEFRDSLKLLPFSVKSIGESFKTTHRKLEMEYEGRRFAGCEITPDEREYIANDVLVVKEALEQAFLEADGLALTIGSACLKEFKKGKGRYEYNELFPDLTKIELDKNLYGSSNADEYVRKGYRGAWCYLVKERRGEMAYGGTTADVNSLYPSMMHSESGNRYPIGKPAFWRGDYIPWDGEDIYWFIRVKTRFYLKPGKLPFIQIKNNLLYKGNECLETSDVYFKGKKLERWRSLDGSISDGRLELTISKTDFYLMREHYDLVDFEILDGCAFYTEIGIFDKYIDKYREIKMREKGARRTLAKLYLNNLYGKMATGQNSSFKVCFLEDGRLKFFTVPKKDKKVVYIPAGAAITSYARAFTITAAQKNYNPGGRGFIYADTDSIHCDLPPDKIRGIKVHNTAFCCWKLESEWDYAMFTRQKTYIEHVVKVDGEQVKKPFFDVKCAGMPENCKDFFIVSTLPFDEKVKYCAERKRKLPREVLKFIAKTRGLTDFDVGLEIPGKLVQRQVPGGTLLCETPYVMRGI